MRIWLFLFLMCMISCNKQDPQEQLQQLEGYWEINKVTLPDGQVKNYTVNTVIDFIELTEDRGVRTKVLPTLEGGFIVTKTQEQFQLKIEADSLRLYYTTPFDSWKETVLITQDSIIKVLNEDGKVYEYKRFRKFEL